MRKIYLFAVFCLALAGMMACSGGKGNKMQDFANSFAGYVNANQMDSIKAVYPTANFDSVAPISTDSIAIDDDGNGKTFRINYSGNTWLDVEMSEDGDITVINSNGIAALPSDKLEIARNTGMITDSTPDVKKQTLLNDSTYFAWLDKNYGGGEYVIQVKPGKYKNIWKPSYGEGSQGTITVTLTNLSDQPISGSDYSIAYKTYESNGYTDYSRRNYTVNNTHKGIDLKPNGSGTIKLTRWETYKFHSFQIKPANGKEDQLKYQYKPTGKEYQEYLESKK